MILEKSRSLDIKTDLEVEPAPQPPVKERPPPYDLHRPPTASASSSSTSTTTERVTIPTPIPDTIPTSAPTTISLPRSPTLYRPSQPRLTSGSSLLNPATPQHVHKFNLHSKQDPISGSYVIDTSLERSDKLMRARAPLHSANKNFFKKKQVPHATFTTNKSAITLDLSTTSATVESRRSHVQVQSRSGTVRTTVLPIPTSLNHICLEVMTKDGNIIVFLPPNFHGGIQFRIKNPRNAVMFLPEFASRARVINGSDKESFVLFGNNDLALSDPKNPELDLCLLSTHTGQITVGVADVDYYQEAKPLGFWKKLLGMGSSRSELEVTQ
ncbi:hypothetical protein EUX98_g2104 [Antrodiella citrinella]|uniref:DUF7330 domain-containing protein n=1 Tax=Antrodiella citrinella TaxID=2447956 RepID=A0A4S4MZT7_9APHY|nr:hypothetical protein EUX98_g2104 [Antrodiella citrinella]